MAEGLTMFCVTATDSGARCDVVQAPVVVLKLRIVNTEDPLEPAVLMSMDGDGAPAAVCAALRAMADRVEELFDRPFDGGRMMN